MSEKWLRVQEAQNGEEPRYSDDFEYYSGSPLSVSPVWIIWAEASDSVMDNIVSNSDVTELIESNAIQDLISSSTVNQDAGPSSFKRSGGR